ncbi:sugar transferase [Streptacidiphilus sp. ASG 303]|uniref:sugar transferase n=1 Tax=Streptacidiphilus sp. ASG 303 TaxID=2896847 RepID=UPI001E52EC9B|nr:sugar transferase [Streptacidiphilus sp. ASG 303]MCD0483740.1 sugar transferase [Streptacidiphilus sp. ASG 303]
MKRGGDLALAVLVGIVAIPLVLAIALLVRLTMGGPVIFRQTRSGRGGQEFEILKFRTMRDSRFPGEPDAPRITRLGHLLRRTSLDELPQLWNVVRGDMAVVGPRPTLPEQVVHYSPRQRGRLAVRPGLTGWAQVRGRNSLTWPERIELDLWYVEHRSPRLDLAILFRTVGVLLRPAGITGAGGVNPGFPVPGEADGTAAAPAAPAVPLRPVPPRAGPVHPRPVVPRQGGPVTPMPARTRYRPAAEAAEEAS